MYDLLIVGAGITAATLVARLRDHLKICVIDCRNHIGGNCYDEQSDGTFIHRYGPHIFHCPSARIIAFLSDFTEWVPYEHKVIAEVLDSDQLRQVPFPYCRQTAEFLGRTLGEAEILDMFFRDYSQKMWGMPWEELPSSVRGRIPMGTAESPIYYRHRFVALPKRGYTQMMHNMLDGAEILLGASPSDWTRIRAKQIVYTGRPDLICAPGEQVPLAEKEGIRLDYRTLDIQWSMENWDIAATCLHACSNARTWTRKTCFARMTGGCSRQVSTEFPAPATAGDLFPFYPIEIPRNRARFELIKIHIRRAFPHLHLAGRLGTYHYYDMYQAVGYALALANRLLPISNFVNNCVV